MILIIATTLIAGCLHNDAPGRIDEETPSPAISGLSVSGIAPVELDFQSAMDGRSFRAWGRLFMNTSEPYLLLNASLIQNGRLIERARLLMIDVQPGPQSFEVSEFVRLPSRGDFRCLLTVSSSEGLLCSGERACQVEDISRSQKYFEPIVSIHGALGTRDETGAGETYAEETGAEEAAASEDDSISENRGSITSGEELDAGESVEEGSLPNDEHSASAFAESEIAGLQGRSYEASKTSTKYHLPSCRYVEQIMPDKRIWFATEEDARSKGYTPCKVCNP